MLDVHAPHESIHTWKDFFIHIATIVIGLLIAVGLEQAVEYVHHRQQATEARKLLQTERAKNQISLRFDMYAVARHEHDLLNDLEVLERVRSHSLLPSDRLILRRYSYGFFSEEWKAIQQNGVIGYLSPEELEGVAYSYFEEDDLVTGSEQTGKALRQASAMLRGSDPPNMTSVIWSPAGDHFYQAFSLPGGAPDEATAQQAYAPWVIPRARYAQLSPTDIDDLEHAIRLALVDDDVQISNCLNIQRWIAPTGLVAR